MWCETQPERVALAYTFELAVHPHACAEAGVATCVRCPDKHAKGGLASPSARAADAPAVVRVGRITGPPIWVCIAAFCSESGALDLRVEGGAVAGLFQLRGLLPCHARPESATRRGQREELIAISRQVSQWPNRCCDCRQALGMGDGVA